MEPEFLLLCSQGPAVHGQFLVKNGWGFLTEILCFLSVAQPVTYYEGVSKSFRTVRLKRELRMVQLSAIRYSCIAIL
jgi:hypothetical protein